MKKITFFVLGTTFLAISIGAAASSTFAWLSTNNFVAASLRDMMAVSTDGNLYVDWDTSYTDGLLDYGIKDGPNGARGHSYRADPSAVADNIVHDVEGTENDGISFQRLRDCSIDMASETPIPYDAIYDGYGALSGEYRQVSQTYSKDNSSSTYYYTKFGLRFIVKAGTGASAYHIFMHTATLNINGSKNNIDSAVRMGIKPHRGDGNTKTEANVYSVWAPNYDQVNTGVDGISLNGSQISFVSSTTGTSEYTFAENSENGTNAFVVAKTSLHYDDISYSNYIGEVGSVSSRPWTLYASEQYYSYIDCDFYFWYEGSDVLCNPKELQDQAYSIALGFRCIKDDGV